MGNANFLADYPFPWPRQKTFEHRHRQFDVLWLRIPSVVSVVRIGMFCISGFVFEAKHIPDTYSVCIGFAFLQWFAACDWTPRAGRCDEDSVIV